MNIPEIMMDLDRWLRWRLIERGDRMSKLPITTKGKAAKSTDPKTWTTFDKANSTWVGDGLGFALGGGIGCIDLDGAINEDGILQTWAKRILDMTPETFIEISQSGQGLHIWGFLPEGMGQNLRSKGLSVEIYSGGPRSGRFIALGSQEWIKSSRELAHLGGLVKELAA